MDAVTRALAEAGHNVAALNFASAKNPGGGFRKGAQAQEECLARCSALYSSLTSPAAAGFYAAGFIDVDVDIDTVVAHLRAHDLSTFLSSLGR